MYRIWWLIWILPVRYHNWILDKTGYRLVKVSADNHLYNFYWTKDWKTVGG